MAADQQRAIVPTADAIKKWLTSTGEEIAIANVTTIYHWDSYGYLLPVATVFAADSDRLSSEGERLVRAIADRVAFNGREVVVIECSDALMPKPGASAGDGLFVRSRNIAAVLAEAGIGIDRIGITLGGPRSLHDQFDEPMHCDKVEVRMFLTPKEWADVLQSWGAFESWPTLDGPLPAPSSMADVALSKLIGTTPVVDFASAVEGLQRCLATAGYVELKYYGVKGGIGITTPLEQTTVEGHPLRGRDRWSASIAPLRPVDGSSYLAALLEAPIGYYRCFLIILSSDVMTRRTVAPTQADVQALVDGGAPRVNPTLAAEVLDEGMACTVYVYEFTRMEDQEQATFVASGRLTCVDHLKAAGVTQ